MTFIQTLGALVGAGALFVLDRIAKAWALQACVNTWYINQYISCELVFNRGVSWSLFSFADDTRFIMLSVVIIAVTLLLCLHAWRIHRGGELVVGQLLVIAGSFSNLIDRFLYGGVIDFIVLSYKSFSWPVFNFADVYVVVGVLLMIVQIYKK